MKTIKFLWDTLKDSFKEWNNSFASQYSASIAYYAIFSIPGLLVIIIWLASYFFGEDAIHGEISRQISGLAGSDVSKSIEDLVANAFVDKDDVLMKTIGVFSLIFGATGLFIQLQKALNELWDIEAAPKKAYLKFLLDRANSLGMILILGFLLMITMVLTSLVSVFNSYITHSLGLETYYLMQLVNLVLSFLVIVFVFAFMFKVLPDVEISWKSVWAGAVLTALLFVLGKFLLNIYFSQFKPTSAFGTAGTIILIMMWINYSCMLVFFGAEFTKVYSYKKGFYIAPSKHAKWTEEKLYRDLQTQKENKS